MKKYTIISTYPAEGSKNIGDQLITSSLIDAIVKLKGSNVVLETVWREDAWENVERAILDSDAIIFACLAIRPDFAKKQYPYIKEVLKTNIPIFVVSAGTALIVNKEGSSIFDYVSDDSRSVLLELDNKAISFTTRGALTQGFCESIGMVNCKFSGDIAFFSSVEGNENKFDYNTEINNIVVSD
ncbi:hypothetical protein L4D09_25695, partial [Photobacterium makurazakiensis]|uniref:hypothetical protein n=1 Tax=Photobacterium makurazakiensis TaxID=2910234 RepID=UPI003D0EBB28